MYPLFLESKLLFQNPSFVSNFSFQLRFEVHLQNWNFVPGIEAKQFKFETLFPTCCYNSLSKLSFQNSSFVSRIELFSPWNQTFDSGNKALSLSHRNRLETRLRIWFVLTSWERSFDSGKEASIAETTLQLWRRGVESKLKKQFGNAASIPETTDIFN